MYFHRFQVRYFSDNLQQPHCYCKDRATPERRSKCHLMYKIHHQVKYQCLNANTLNCSRHLAFHASLVMVKLVNLIILLCNQWQLTSSNCTCSTVFTMHLTEVHQHLYVVRAIINSAIIQSLIKHMLPFVIIV